MANPVRGEVAFEVEGQGYVLLLDFNALCDLEGVVPGLMDGATVNMTPTAIRAVFHAGLQDRHAGLSLREAGGLIQALGVERAAELVKAAFEASFPKAGGEGAKRPRKGQPKAGAGNAR